MQKLSTIKPQKTNKLTVLTKQKASQTHKNPYNMQEAELHKGWWPTGNEDRRLGGLDSSTRHHTSSIKSVPPTELRMCSLCKTYGGSEGRDHLVSHLLNGIFVT